METSDKPFGSDYLEPLSVEADEEIYGADSGPCPQQGPPGTTCTSSCYNGTCNHHPDT